MLNTPARASVKIFFPRIITLLLLICAGAVFGGAWNPPIPLRIALGFLYFFALPGWLMIKVCIPQARFHPLEQFPFSIAFSLGIFAFPGLAAYLFELSLRNVLIIHLALTLILWLALFFVNLRGTKENADAGQINRVTAIAAGSLALALLMISYFAGASRGYGYDWDYMTYIAYVVKLVSRDAASNAHFAYAAAPLDPIHSYNIWALLWSLIAKYARVSPIELYIGAGFLTVPASLLAFFTMARRMLAPAPALAAVTLYAIYQVVYGGLFFIGQSTFYPDDAMWFMVFPCCLALLLDYLRHGGKGLLAGLCLSVMGMSIVHVLWGLSFYAAAAFLICGIALDKCGLYQAALEKWPERGKSLFIASAGLWSVPLLIALVWIIIMAAKESPDWFAPLFPVMPLDSVWLYALIFVALPLVLLGLWLGDDLAETLKALAADDTVRKIIIVIGLAFLISLPYVLLRYGAVQNTVWERFGINPYRGLLTGKLFLLNPFQRTLTDPNISFVPVYIIGLLGTGLLWRERKAGPGALLALCIMIAVPLIIFYPVFATLFARFFSLGYLRRFMRLWAMISFIPAGLLITSAVRKLASFERSPLRYALSVLVISLLISLASIAIPARPFYYNDLLGKMIRIIREEPRYSLLIDDRPFRAVVEQNLAGPGTVVFSDLLTSYNITAYLDVSVAARVKPGVGVPDQEQREKDEAEFFNSETPLPRMREILSRYNAQLVIINRSPAYYLYTYACGHPETVGKLAGDSAHFTKIFDQGDWVIFKGGRGQSRRDPSG